jgi:hypothetical protein
MKILLLIVSINIMWKLTIIFTLFFPYIRPYLEKEGDLVFTHAYAQELIGQSSSCAPSTHTYISSSLL